MKVRAIRFGFFGNSKRKEGDIFDIENEKQFSSKWMEYDEVSEAVEEQVLKPKSPYKKAVKAPVGVSPAMEDVI